MIFALDVGTRKVAGLIADRDGENVIIYDVEIAEHEKRAMLDGQVHDVENVARTVSRVKRILESRNGIELKNVAIALAGRFLKTVKGKASIELPQDTITQDTVTNLELKAVGDAVEKLSDEEMYCVGYSVLSYELDGSWMMKLEGHRGKMASVEVIAAFLPAQVVDAMSSVMKEVGLVIDHMTLEPIAAMDVAVPEDLRLLNLALVDVGAGTSDIAISNDGTVVAYGMVPKAGDEITEMIAREYLLDFHVAESVKRALSENDEFVVKDILDNEKLLRREEILKLIDPVIDSITKEIADLIVDLNSGKPKAVMVVGGGAKVPGFVEKLRYHLDLPPDRVSLKGVENLRYVIDETGKVKGSEMVTPVGIARSALFGKGTVFSKVYVNGEPIKLIGLSGRYTVMQVLLQAGYDISEVLGKSVGTIVYELNGKIKAHKGKMITPIIKVNGERANTRTYVKHDDRIEITVPDVEIEKPKVRDVVERIRVRIDSRIVEILPDVMVNGEIANPDVEINDGDKIEYEPYMPVLRLKEKLSKSMTVYVNEEPVFLRADVEIFKDGKRLEDTDLVKVSDEVEARFTRVPKVKDVIDRDIPKIKVIFNGDVVELPTKEVEVFSKGKKLSLEDELEDGMQLEVVYRDSVPIVATLLAKVDLDIGSFRRYKILKNGRECSFAEPLSDGDVIDFEKEG